MHHPLSAARIGSAGLAISPPRQLTETTTAVAVQQQNVLFIGNLSFFCEDHHLFDLFNEYGIVEKVVVVHDADYTKSLLFGFVTMATAHTAQEVLRLLDGHMFMGRRMK
jgi:RNA recognition motif-containing protein